jgi:predicted PurR-regulated permease PerM
MPEEKRVISISTGTIIRVVLVLLGVWFVYVTRTLIGVLLVSVLLAAVLDPIVDWFEKKHIPRSVTVTLLYVVIFVILAVLLLAIIPPMIVEVRGVAENFGGLWKKVVSSFDALHTISARYGLEASFQSSIDALNDAVSGSFASLFSTVTGALSGIVSFFIMLVISFFLVVEKDSIRDIVNSILPKRHHEHVGSMLIKMQHKVGQWLIGQLVLMLFIGVLSYIGLLVFGVKYALLLAVLAGLFEVVPYLGPVAAAIPAVFFAAVDSPTKGILILAFYLVIQRVEHMILVPKIMQKTTGLNPIMVILALSVGFTVGGIAGGLLSIPVAAALNALLSDYLERQNKQTA